MDKTEKKIKSDPRLRVFDEKTPFLVLLRYKYLTLYFLKKVLWVIFRYVLLIGISFIIIYPYISKITSSFMSREDFVDTTVKLISKYPTLDTYKAIINDNNYFLAVRNTALLSFICGFVQMMICSIVGYGFAKFKFKFKGPLFLCVLFMMIVPHTTIQYSMFSQFRYFDIWGIYGLIGKIFNFDASKGLMSLTNSNIPLYIMSATGLAFKNGLFIFIMRQYFRGIPDELEEAAYVDGAGVFKTFFKIIIPMAIPMMVTIFMFAFSWQWTDMFYSDLFYSSGDSVYLMPEIINKIPKSLIDESFPKKTEYNTAIRNTCGIMILLPLLIIYLFAQRTLIEGVERSGLTG